jgi:hypothetical protein
MALNLQFGMTLAMSMRRWSPIPAPTVQCIVLSPRLESSKGGVEPPPRIPRRQRHTHRPKLAPDKCLCLRCRPQSAPGPESGRSGSENHPPHPPKHPTQHFPTPASWIFDPSTQSIWHLSRGADFLEI